MTPLTPSALHNELKKAFDARTRTIIDQEIEATLVRVKARIQAEAATVYVNIITHEDWNEMRREMNIHLSFEPVVAPTEEAKP